MLHGIASDFARLRQLVPKHHNEKGVSWTQRDNTYLNCTLNSSSMSSSSQLSSQSLSPPDLAAPGAAPPRWARSVWESSQSALNQILKFSKELRHEDATNPLLQTLQIRHLLPIRPGVNGYPLLSVVLRLLSCFLRVSMWMLMRTWCQYKCWLRRVV